MAKILVTGASGFVGKSLVPALVEAGHSVVCAVTSEVDWLSAEQITINRLENQKDWGTVLPGIDIVIHLAARVHVMNDNSISPIEDYCKVNSEATKILAEQSAKYGVKRFVYLSTMKVNGEYTEDKPFTEEIHEAPKDPYALSKFQAEQYIQEIGNKTGMEFVILRPPLIYGPGVKANFLKMIQLVEKKWPLPFAKVENKRSLLYLGNLISALCQVVEHKNAANQVFLISDNEAVAVPSLLREISNALGVKTKLIPFPTRLLIVLFKVLRLNGLKERLLSSFEVDNYKIRSTIGWEPPYSFRQGILSTVRWYQVSRKK